MKKFIPLLALAAFGIFLFLWLQPGVNAMDNQNQAIFFADQKMYISNGQAIAMDVAPLLRNDRVCVPVRYLGLALGIDSQDIAWDTAANSVTLNTTGVKIRLTIGSNLLSAGEREQKMDVAPLLADGRVFIPARWLAEAMGYEAKWDEATRTVLVGPPGDLPKPPAKTNDLPVVGTGENLKNLLAKVQAQPPFLQNEINALGTAPARERAAKSAELSKADSAMQHAMQPETGTADYSGTNIQVEGVDEADIVKTDGSYIYQVSGERIVISKAYPPEEMEVVSTLSFAEKNFSPQEMYVDGQHLIVIGNTCRYRDVPLGSRPEISPKKLAPSIFPPPYTFDMVKTVIYDLSDKSSPNKVRELELCGRYVSSRKVGPSFYLIADQAIYLYDQKENEPPRPFFRDTALGEEIVEIDYSRIKCFPDFIRPNYLLVAGINLDRPQEKADIQTFLGAGENIYASPQNLYVAVTSRWEQPVEIMPGPDLTPWIVAYEDKTKVYKFALNDGCLKYLTCGEAPGAILNQFSMDEQDGYFRLATTKGDIWRTGQYTSKNNVYILDEGLNMVGKLEDIAPGEKIYSVRFVGNRGYMVTFKTVDPFFVIDLQDPRHPQILGALKIPGYSDYLHPYDENHILGFGKDTFELEQKDSSGNATGSMAFYAGMKMAIFDVSDVNNPVEMCKETIGDRGTDSELLRNHKALLFSREKNLLAFPVTVMETKGSGEQEKGFPAYGEFSFQGAYVYNVDLASGFTLKGKISHLSNEDYLKAGHHWYDSEKNVKRVIYIHDSLYTISNKYIKANNLGNLEEIKTLELN